MSDSYSYDISLINHRTAERISMSLGATLEAADFAIDQTGLERIQLRFIPAEGALLLEQRAGTPVTLDGVSVIGRQQVRDGSVLVIGPDVYTVELTRRDLNPLGTETLLPDDDHQPLTLNVGAVTMTGSVRDHNEDAVGVYLHPDASCLIVADGVGGAEAGEYVSQFAVQYLLNAFKGNLGMRYPWPDVFRRALTEINNEVRAYSREMSSRAGRTLYSGSTLTCAVIEGRTVYVVHIGDSRMYHFGSRGARQVTDDHSKFPEIPSDQQLTSGKRNVLMRGIGKFDTIDPDVFAFEIQPGDTLLMCSDGMSDRYTIEEIAPQIGQTPPQALAEHLAHTADARKSNDNVSVIVATAMTGTPSIVPAPGVRVFAPDNLDPRPRLMKPEASTVVEPPAAQAPAAQAPAAQVPAAKPPPAKAPPAARHDEATGEMPVPAYNPPRARRADEDDTGARLPVPDIDARLENGGGRRGLWVIAAIILIGVIVAAVFLLTRPNATGVAAPLETETPAATAAPTEASTDAPSATPTDEPTDEPTATMSATASRTPAPSRTPTATATDTPSLTPTASDTPTPEPTTAVPTKTAVPRSGLDLPEIVAYPPQL
jgi:protein phosphatase